MEGVLIRYPFGISYTLIAEMAEDTEVVTIVLDAGEQSFVEGEYQRCGVNLNNCSFLHAPSDSYWTRDFGPWFIIDGNQTQGIVNFDYPWPQPNDELIPFVYGQDQGIPVYDTGLYHEGGNYMTDGQGFALSTDLVWDDNPGVSHDDIYNMALDYLGVHTYRIIPDAQGGFLKHIDCFAKYLSPDTIMVLEVPPNDPTYTGLEDAVDYFENRISCYGTPYKTVRVYSPNGEPYVNSLILNNKVLIPITGSQWDDDAIASYQAAMPGYEVLGFYGSWHWFDALHCRTMGITDRHMLCIGHTPLLDRPPAAPGFPVEAEIIDYSGQGFTGGTPTVYWKTTGGWNSTPMSHVSGNDYLANIPAQPAGATIQYYIHAEDASGRSEDHPYIGEPDPHTFTVNTLGTDIKAISADAGGVVNLHLNAGPANSNRNYFVLGSASGTEPGFTLPGGQLLPLNWDLFTGMTFKFANTIFFTDFHAVLDASGVGSARFDTVGPLPREALGLTLNFACLLYSPYDFVSNPVAIKIVE